MYNPGSGCVNIYHFLCMHYGTSHHSCVCVCVLSIFCFLVGKVIVYTVLDRGCMYELVGRYLSMFVQDYCCYVCVVDYMLTNYRDI